MFHLIFAAILIALAFAVGPVFRSANPEGGKAAPRVIAGVLGVIALVLVVTSFLVLVGTKDVGVVTSFGRPTGRDLPNGLHVKLPWEKVTVMDAAIQPDDFSGDGNCIKVRIGDSSTACASMTIRWQIAEDEASTLFQNYRSNDVNATIRTSLVETNLKAAVNDVLGAYNPLANVDVAATGKANDTKISAAPNLDAFSTQILSQMNKRLAALNNGKPQIHILSVTMSFLDLAPTTQAKINAYQAEVGNTRIAQQQEQTAAAQAAANKALSASVSHDPNVLVSKCFDTFEEMVKDKQPIPAGFSCWPGSSANVLVNGTTSGK